MTKSKLKIAELRKAKLCFSESGFDVNFIISDIYSFETFEKYDIAIC